MPAEPAETPKAVHKPEFQSLHHRRASLITCYRDWPVIPVDSSKINQIETDVDLAVSYSQDNPNDVQ